MDTTREELPDTMAAVRLSGMEISDLTMELSDLGLVPLNFELLQIQKIFVIIMLRNSYPFVCSQEITHGVRSSTRAVRLAEERLRRLTNMKPIG